jgi:hypothetical protein
LEKLSDSELSSWEGEGETSRRVRRGRARDKRGLPRRAPSKGGKREEDSESSKEGREEASRKSLEELGRKKAPKGGKREEDSQEEGRGSF